MIRQPAVAGQFYTDNPVKLLEDLRRMIPEGAGKRQVVGVVSPHAGYIYSGRVAGVLLASVTIPRTVVVLGPNHHGIGARGAMSPHAAWSTPLGEVPLNGRLAELVVRHAGNVQYDEVAHRFEHSLEVQIPFLQFLNPEVSIVPICLGFSDFNSCLALGKGLAAAIREFGEEVLIVASSDMTHYESAESARKKDSLALEKMLAFDAKGLLSICREKGITMCGVVPAVVMLVAASDLGASRAELVAYATSGDVTGDNRQVVAYAAVEVW